MGFDAFFSKYRGIIMFEFNTGNLYWQMILIYHWKMTGLLNTKELKVAPLRFVKNVFDFYKIVVKLFILVIYSTNITLFYLDFITFVLWDILREYVNVEPLFI